jgi:transglutaminase-like putative cysteine protease
LSRRFLLLVALCLATSVGLVSYKLWGRGWLRALGEASARWSVDVQVHVPPGTDSSRLQLALADKATAEIEDERFQHEGWELSLRSRREQRVARFSPSLTAASSARQLNYRFSVRPREPAVEAENKEDLPADALGASEEIPSDDDAILRQAKYLTEPARDEESRVRALFDFVQDEVIASASKTGALQALRERSGDDAARARLFVALTRSIGVPSRLVHGIPLIEGASRPVHLRADVFLDGHWTAVDPVRGRFGGSTAGELVLMRGDGELAQLESGRTVELHVSTARESNLEGAIRQRIRSGHAHWTDRLSPLAFPARTQLVLQLLLLLPLGALVISIGRNFLGLPTFGTFAPLLLALAFHETPLLPSILLLAIVLVVGSVARLLIDRLRLLLVPRLSVLLTVVVSIVVAIDFLLVGSNKEPLFSMALLPMVIFTMTIERLSLMAAEEGWRATLKTLGGTVVVTVACYLIVRSHTLQRTFLLFPELNLSVVSGLLLMGRYTGYRVSEWMRFRALGEERAPPMPGLDP